MPTLVRRKSLLSILGLTGSNIVKLKPCGSYQIYRTQLETLTCESISEYELFRAMRNNKEDDNGNRWVRMVDLIEESNIDKKIILEAIINGYSK